MTLCFMIHEASVVAGRPKPNVFDFEYAFTVVKADYARLIQFCFSKQSVDFELREEKKSFPVKLVLEKAKVQPDAFQSTLAKYPERPKYIPEYLPLLPPLHTFKKTFARAKREEDKGMLAMQKTDQVRQVQSQLLRLMEITNGLPRYANYEA